jgi:hypothetical protein
VRADITDNIENLTHEMLRRMHGKLDKIQTEMRLRFTGVETGLAAIEHRLVAFHLTDVARADEITDLRRRIERRLDWVDTPWNVARSLEEWGPGS